MAIRNSIFLGCAILLSGIVMFGAHGTTRATPAVGESTRLNSAQARSSVDRIVKLVEERQFDKALSDADALEKRYPRSPTVAYVKGAVYLARNDLTNARKSFERALALKPDYSAAALQLAQMDLQAKNPVAARKRLQAILTAEPANADAMLALADVAATAGDETEYLSWLEKAAKAQPALPRPQALLASYYLRKNDIPKAMAIATNVQAANPNNPMALDTLGTVQLAAGERDNALKTFARLAGVAPNDANVHLKLATAQLAVRDVASARIELKRALALKPDLPDAKILLGSVELVSGQGGEALRIAREVQKQDPRSGPAWSLEGDVLMTQKDFAAAEKAYNTSFAIHQSASLAMKRHAAYVAAGKDKEAEAVLLSWLKDRPNDAGTRQYLAASYAKSGKRKEALDQFEFLVRADPGNAAAMSGLARLYQQEKDSRALPTAERALKLRPDSAEIMDTTGWILVEQGNIARGRDLLQTAAAKAPGSPVIRYHLAAALAKSGDVPGARRELESALQKDANFPERAAAEALLSHLPK